MTIIAAPTVESAGDEPRRTVGAVPPPGDTWRDAVTHPEHEVSGVRDPQTDALDRAARSAVDPKASAAVNGGAIGAADRGTSGVPDGGSGAPAHGPRPWLLVFQAGCAMAAAMGIGRFVYTPVLPLMHDHAGLSRQMGANVATANYVGYLAGALITIVVPQVTRSRWALRLGLIVMAASLALMPAAHDTNLWLSCRYVAGLCSGIVFINCAGAVLSGLKAYGHHLVGWAFGGIGVGIAASGAMVLAVREAGTWEEAWLYAAAMVALGAAASWTLPMAPAPVKAPPSHDGGRAARRSFVALAVSYSVEGVGYIIAGTFLVAAINQNSPGWVGTGAWVLVGVAAIPSAVLWAWLAHHWSRPSLMVTALLIQVVGVLLPVLFDGATAALLCAVFFGATFLGIAMMALAIGNHLGLPGAVAILTLGYSVGQMLGPLVVTPLLDGGYQTALAVSAGIVAASALAAAVLRIGFPHELGPLPRSLTRPQS